VGYGNACFLQINKGKFMKTLLRFSLIVFCLFSVLIMMPESTTRAQGGVTVTTKNQLKLRGGPGTKYNALVMIPAKTELPATGRDNTNKWLQVNFNGAVGWLTVPYLVINGDINTLPVIQAPTPAPTFTRTPKPTPTPKPPKAGRELSTAKGLIRVLKTKTTQVLPLNCTFQCTRANAGYTFLLVYFRANGRVSPDDLYEAIKTEFGQSYLVAADGTKGDTFSATYSRSIGSWEIYVSYVVPSAQHKFQLFWPNNTSPVNVKG
jgi:uncharacterized protein YraI